MGPRRQRRRTIGGELVGEFLASAEIAATINFPSEEERRRAARSARDHARRAQHHNLWIKQIGKAGLLLIDLDKAPPAVVAAYNAQAKRPRQR